MGLHQGLQFGRVELAHGLRDAQQAVLDAQFQNVPALVNLAMFQMQRDSATGGQGCADDMDCAKKNLQRALAIDDAYMPAFNQLALYYFQQTKKRAGAIKSSQKGSKGRQMATNAAIAKRADVQQLELAALVCSQAIRKNAGYAPIYNTAGLVHAAMGDSTSAADMAMKATTRPELTLTSATAVRPYPPPSISAPRIAALIHSRRSGQRAPRQRMKPAKAKEIGLALEVAPRLKAGVVWVNTANQFDASCGFGGYRESGYGREGGREGGRVLIRATLQALPNNLLQIGVEDDAAGVHRELWERIFELGFTTRSEGGSGLGLYITRSLVEALGGRVYISDSIMLWGTTFMIELPTE